MIVFEQGVIVSAKLTPRFQKKIPKKVEKSPVLTNDREIDSDDDEFVYNLLVEDEDYLFDLVIPGFIAVFATISLYLKRRLE
jgi:hypothetical protein